MRRTVVMLVCLTLAGLPTVRADVIDEERNSSEVRTAHHELRDAVAKIRRFYSPGHNVIDAYALAGMVHRAGLGIILGGAWVQGASEAGAVVVAVTPGSPAEEAGLVAGDVITSFNGEALVGENYDAGIISALASRRLAELSRGLEDGDKVTLEFERDGTTHQVDLVARKIQFSPEVVRQFGDENFGRAFGGYPLGVSPGGDKWFLPRAWLDMELVVLNAELGEYFGAESGVLVVRGPEKDDALGLKSGDVILSIGGREVRSPEHAMRILRSYEPEEPLTVQIVRHGRSQTLTGTVPESPIDFNFRWNFRDQWGSSED